MVLTASLCLAAVAACGGGAARPDGGGGGADDAHVDEPVSSDAFGPFTSSTAPEPRVTMARMIGTGVGVTWAHVFDDGSMLIGSIGPMVLFGPNGPSDTPIVTTADRPWIARLDQQTVAVWTKSFGPSAQTSGWVAPAVLSDGAVIAASEGGLARFSADGAPGWTSTDRVFSVAATPDDDVVVVTGGAVARLRGGTGALAWSRSKDSLALPVPYIQALTIVTVADDGSPILGMTDATGFGGLYVRLPPTGDPSATPAWRRTIDHYLFPWALRGDGSILGFQIATNSAPATWRTLSASTGADLASVVDTSVVALDTLASGRGRTVGLGSRYANGYGGAEQAFIAEWDDPGAYRWIVRGGETYDCATPGPGRSTYIFGVISFEAAGESTETRLLWTGAPFVAPKAGTYLFVLRVEP